MLGPMATFDMVRRADGTDGEAAEATPGERAASEAAIAAGIASGSIDEPAVLPPVSTAPADSAVAGDGAPPPTPAAEMSASEAGSSAAAAPDSSEELPTVEECAALAASIDRSPDQRDATLEERELQPEQWRAIEAHWNEAISTETAKGRSTLRGAYDVAYVEQLERERGPLEPAEYAKLVVAAEAGESADTLASLELPRGALLRIERVMTNRVADNASLAEQVRKAIQAERAE